MHPLLPPAQEWARTGSSEVGALLSLLTTGTPREVLARIVPGDPLDLRRRVALRLRSQALLLDCEQVLLGAFARTAYRSGTWRGRPELEPWLAGIVDETIEDALTELEAEPGPGDLFAIFATPLGLEPRELREGCARFNRLPTEDREAFLHLVLEDGPQESFCRERGLRVAELVRRARRALEVLGSPSLAPPQPERPS